MSYQVKIKKGDVAVVVVNGCEYKISVRTITPALARRIVEESDKVFTNRPSRRHAVNAYKKNMRDGLWKNNGDALVFRSDGALLDGRHRMVALSELSDSEVSSLDFLVISNLNAGVEDTIDIGAQRSLDAALAFTGLHREKNVSGILQMKEKLDKRLHFTDASATANGLTRTELVDKFSENPDMYNNAAVYARDVYNDSAKVLTAKEVGAIFLHLTDTLGYEEDFVKCFFTNLATSPRSGRNIYSNAMKKLTDRKHYKVGQTDRLNLFIQTWNSYVAGCGKRNVPFTSNDWFNAPKEEVVAGVVNRGSEPAKQQNSLFD